VLKHFSRQKPVCRPSRPPPLRISRQYAGLLFHGTVFFARILAMFAKKPGHERRRAARGTITSPAWIRLENSFAVRPCRVMDLSKTGARLLVEGEITESFALLLSRNAAGRKARIKWRRGNQVGIQFE
jgi:hypothetical protein